MPFVLSMASDWSPVRWSGTTALPSAPPVPSLGRSRICWRPGQRQTAKMPRHHLSGCRRPAIPAAKRGPVSTATTTITASWNSPPADYALKKGQWTTELNFLAWQPYGKAEVADLPEGTRLRLSLQWREPHDPDYFAAAEGQDFYRKPLANLKLALLRSAMPAAKPPTLTLWIWWP